MTLKVWLCIALAVSMLINGFLLWFAREQSRHLSYVSQNLGDLVELIANYKEHLRKVYSLEMFYGDETLKLLLEHTKDLLFLLQDEYGDITHITEPLDVILEEEEDEEDEEEIPQEKDVFYGGSRRSDS